MPLNTNIMALLRLALGLTILAVCSARMNVLFLVSDDMRPELGSYLGPDFPSPVHPKMISPNLDRLAKKSLLLKRAYVQQAVCSPSRTSLLTSRRPDTTHVYDLKAYFRKVGGNFTTIPQYFKNHGYATVGMGKIFHPGRASGHDDPVSWNMPYFHGNRTFETRQHSWLAVPDKELRSRPLVDEQIARHAIKTLDLLAPDALTGKRPFFAAVGFHKPHLPFVFPESLLKDYDSMAVRTPDNGYAPVDMPDVAWQGNTEIRGYSDVSGLNYSGAINSTLPKFKVIELRRAYYCALTWTDSLVGRVLDHLAALGLADTTIVSFWGDHGWQLGEHGAWAKATNFELATHAPMMLHVPGVTDAGVETRQLTEFVDLFPTLVEATGLPGLKPCPKNSTQVELCTEGTNLLPLINHPDRPVKEAAFSQYPRGRDVMGYTMRTERYRYTEWVKFTYAPVYLPQWDKVAGVELYDHWVDPEENYNRADDPTYKDRRKKLSRRLHEGWRRAQ